MEQDAVIPQPHEARGPMVLICEDDPALREFLRVALDGDFRFAETGDGIEAVELARSLHPDVVLLDVMLPGQSGLEALRMIRADANLDDLKIIVMTAFSDVRDSDVAAAGANAFLAKPFDPMELVQAVEELIARDR